MGRPKGSKNKKTLAKLEAERVSITEEQKEVLAQMPPPKLDVEKKGILSSIQKFFGIKRDTK